MSVSVGVSRFYCIDVVFMQPAVKVNGACECDGLLLKQLLPDICQAADDFYFPAHYPCARALSCYDTRLRTSHQKYGPPTDQSLVLSDIDSHSVMRLSETTTDVKHR